MPRSALIPAFLSAVLLAGCVVEPLDEATEGDPASAQPALSFGGGNGPIFGPQDDPSIVSASVANKLPHAVVHDHVQTAGVDPVYANQEVTVWAISTHGLSEKRWNVNTRTWTNWISRGNQSGQDQLGGFWQSAGYSSPSTWSPYLPMAATFDSQGRAHVRGVLGFNDGFGTPRIGFPSLVGTPQLGSSPTYAWQRIQAPAGGFIPRTSASWRDASGDEHVRVFGTDTAKRNLIEMRFDGGAWTTTTHTSHGAGKLFVGSQSAAFDPVSGQGYVCYEHQPYNYHSSVDGFGCRYWDGSIWTTLSFASPSHGWVDGFGDVGLVLLGYRENGAFKAKIVVNARSVDNQNGNAVYVRTLSGASSPEYGWAKWHVPAGTCLTSGVVWYDGSHAGAPRFNVFGQTGDGRLASFFYAGTQWAFGDYVAAPNGEAFTTDTSYAVDSLSFDRVSVVGRTTSGRIWERFFTLENGVSTDWTWADLSKNGLVMQ
jgi:hypothetical protein